MSEKFISLTVTPRDFASRFNKTRAVYTSKSRQAIDNIAEYAKLIWQLEVPVRTGKLKESIRVKSKKTEGGTTDLRSTILIGPSVPYYDYIDRGTSESAGRFVPVLGKRLTNFPDSPDFGFHPGITRQNITERVADKVEKRTGVVLNQVLKSWEGTWGTMFAGSG